MFFDITGSFWQRFSTLTAERSPFCCGVDPSDELLQAWDLPVSALGVRAFCDRLLEAANGSVAIFKPQSAFFERFGAEGFAELKRFVGNAQDQGSLVIIDCKRNDIGHSLTAYAKGLIGRDSPMGPDAITLNCYLGPETLRSAVEHAYDQRAGVFVVAMSSNPEGRSLQSARLEDGRTVSEYVADCVTDFNNAYDEEVGPVGAVVGATSGELGRSLVSRMPKSLFLVPGLGAQGASTDDVAYVFEGATHRVIPSSSRSTLSQGPKLESLRMRIQQEVELALKLRM